MKIKFWSKYNFVAERTTKTGFSGWIAAAVIGVLFLVAGVILAVYILYRRKKEPKLITVEEGSDVILPCSVWPEKNLRSTKFVWKKTDDNVFLYDNGEHPGQSEQFKGRVSHFPDELEQGNASIIISNTTRADSGEYRCIIPLIHKQQKFQINVVVGTEVIKVEEGSDVTLPCSLWPKEDIRLTRFIWKKMPQNDESQMEVFLYDEEPKLITVEEGSDVTLPCSLWPKEDIRSTRFVWRKNYDGQMVFLYDKDDLYSDERPSCKFQGRVSHFPDKLEQGNASITIRNTTRADSGDYRCSFPKIRKPKKFHIKLIVGEYLE